MQKLGFNVHPIPGLDKNKALNLIRETKPQTVLVLNDSAFASQICDLGVPYVILRITKNDDEIHLKLNSFREWWNLVKLNYVDKRLIVHFCNEPHPNLSKLSTFCEEGMDILYQEGLRGVFGNFGVGTPEPIDLKTSLKPMLDKMVNYNKEREMFFVGLHEYIMGSAEVSYPYELGRYKELKKLYPDIKIIMTEFGYDYIEDLAKHGVPALRGWIDHRDAFGDEKAFNEIKKCFDLYYNYDDSIVGTCYFSYGNSGGWEKYDLRNWGYFIDHMNETAFEVPLGEKVVIESTSEKGTNRRTGPGTSYSIFGSVTKPVEVEFIKSEGVWEQYKFQDGAYWVHRDFIRKVSTEVKTIKITLYDAPDEVVEAVKAAIVTLGAYLVQYNAEIS